MNTTSGAGGGPLALEHSARACPALPTTAEEPTRTNEIAGRRDGSSSAAGFELSCGHNSGEVLVPEFLSRIIESKLLNDEELREFLSRYGPFADQSRAGRNQASDTVIHGKTVVHAVG